MTHNKTGTSLYLLSVVAAGTVNRGRGVTVNGYQYDGSTYTEYAGIAKEGASSGENVEYTKYGVEICESGAAITKGDYVGFDTSGRVVTNTSAITDLVVGIALETATGAGEEIRILLGEWNAQRPSAAGLTVQGVAVATLDATAGVAIGAHGLGVTLPDNAIIRDSLVDVVTTFTSATDAATIALHTQTAGDIVAAVAISAGSNPWDAGLHAGVPVGTAATSIKLTAAREITATVAVEDLTAGVLVVFIDYVLSI